MGGTYVKSWSASSKLQGPSGTRWKSALCWTCLSLCISLLLGFLDLYHSCEP